MLPLPDGEEAGLDERHARRARGPDATLDRGASVVGGELHDRRGRRRGANRDRGRSHGSHEGRRRAGTEALPSIAGFAAAARSASALTMQDHARVTELRDRLERTLTGALDAVRVNGTAPRVGNTSNLHFDGIDSDRLLATLDRAGIDASSGSACSASAPEPSHVLLAMGHSRKDALSAIRFSLSRLTTSAEIDRAIAATIEAVETLRRSWR